VRLAAQLTVTGPGSIVYVMKSLVEIEKAIAQLPQESQRQLVRDMPVLCPDAFPRDGWDAILGDSSPRPALSQLLDELDAEYQSNPGQFPALSEDSLSVLAQ
jgi:hypothetical protein